jgi:hypothetical protein
MLKAYIQKLMKGEDLDQVSCQNAVDAMLNPGSPGIAGKLINY